MVPERSSSGIWCLMTKTIRIMLVRSVRAIFDLTLCYWHFFEITTLAAILCNFECMSAHVNEKIWISSVFRNSILQCHLIKCDIIYEKKNICVSPHQWNDSICVFLLALICESRSHHMCELKLQWELILWKIGKHLCILPPPSFHHGH